MEEKELWLPVKNYENIYHVSSLGRIKNINYKKSGKERLLTPCLSNRGYLIINLCVNNTQKSRTVHQLVAESFHNHNPCGHEKVINHINFIKTDNRAINLEIVSNRDNCNMKHFKHSSLYTGVSYNNTHKRWISAIVIQGKRHHIGSFKNELDAKKAYDSALYNWDNFKTKPKSAQYSSKHKGVSFNKRTQKWVAYIDNCNKRIHLGYFKTEKEALNAIKNFKN